MLGGLVAVVIAVWFYRSAEARGLPNIHWAVAGLIAYYVPNFAWSLLLAKPWLAKLHAQNAPVLTSVVGHSSILVGLVVAWFVHRQFLMKTPKPQP